MRRARGIGLGILSGLLLAWSFPPTSVAILAFVALVPALYARHRIARGKHEAALVLAIPWLIWLELTLWGMWPGLLWLKLLPLGIGAAVYGAAVATWREKPPDWRWYPWACAAAFVTLEWLRSVTPLGMAGFLAVTQHRSSSILQLAALTGPWGITFLIALVNFALIAALVGKRLVTAGLAIALVVTVTRLGERRAKAPLPEVEIVRAALIQPGQPSPEDPDEILPERQAIAEALRRGDFTASSRAYLAELLAGTEKARMKFSPGSQPDLVVWPESILQTDPRGTPGLEDVIRDHARKWDAAIVAPFFSPHIGVRPHFAMLGVWDRRGELLGTYRKQHASYGSDYEAGTPSSPTFKLDPEGKVRLGTMICFDFDFLDVPRNLVRAGANLIVAPSDDGYPGIGRWHYAHLPLHSAMHGVPILRADTAFASVVTDFRGRYAVTPYKWGVKASPQLVPVPHVLVPATAGTLYTRFGDWFAWLCAAGTLALAALSFRPRHRKGKGRK